MEGCVEARPEPYDLDDTPPEPSNPDTLWVPYFWPDEPDIGPGGYDNRYLPDSTSGNQATRQKHTGKYNGTPGIIDEIPTTTRGPNKSCGQPILPLISDKATLLSAIDNMIGWNDSGTMIPVGMAWGWRVLSPEEPFTEGAPYGDDRTQKIMIVLTDGENQFWGGFDTHNLSHYTAHGYLATGRLGTTTRGGSTAALNAKTTTVCERIKAKGILLYTITFTVRNSATQTMMRNCATKPSMYFDSPSPGDLDAVFDAIATDLSRLRISR